MDTYTVYALVNLGTGKTFYIGKSKEKCGSGCVTKTGKWRLGDHMYAARNGATGHVYREIRRITEEGNTVEFRELRTGLPHEAACQVERDYIATIGLDNLCNTTFGGEDRRMKGSAKPRVAKRPLHPDSVPIFLENPDTGVQGRFDSETKAADFLGVERAKLHRALENRWAIDGYVITREGTTASS